MKRMLLGWATAVAVPLLLAAPMQLAQAPAATQSASEARPAASVPAAAKPASAPPAKAASAAPPPKAESSPNAMTMAGGNGRLHLLVNPVPLPTGRVGVPYPRIRIVLEGVPPYDVIVEGKLPPGMALGEDGYLGGTPTAPFSTRFLVRASDSATPPTIAQQAYSLRIVAPGTAPARPASAASAPLPPAPLKDLSTDETLKLPQAPRVSAMAWRLTEKDLDELVPDPAAPEPPAAAAPAEASSAPAVDPASAAPPPAPVTEAAKAAADNELALALQRRQLLKPLLEAEFPTQALFESAVSSHLCHYMRALVDQAERDRGLPSSGGTAVKCNEAMVPGTPARPASAAAKPASAPKSARADAPPAAPPRAIPLASLPAWLLPPDFAAQLVKAARKTYPLGDAKPPQWTGGGCGCVHEDLAHEIYGFYPFWANEGKPQQLDFSLLTRLATHASTFDDQGNLIAPDSWTAPDTGFALQARRHGTQMDLVVWRNEWKTLLALDEGPLERAAVALARGALAAADAPLRPRGWQRYLPVYAGKPPMAQGLTIFFDGAPNADGDRKAAQAYNFFLRKFMVTLLERMRQAAPRTYMLHVVLPFAQIGSAPYDYPTLLEYIKRTEEPKQENDRILDGAEIPQSQTNVTLRFLVLLPEPTAHSKKGLRVSLDQAAGVHGNDRRVLLRKIIAGIPSLGNDPLQLTDDLSYIRDNFGGVAIWRAPVEAVANGAEVYDAVNAAFRRSASREPGEVCAWVCPYRWEARLVFQLLFFGVVLGMVGVAIAGGVRCAGRRYMAGLGLTMLAMAAVGIALLNCDFELKRLREGNLPFIAVLAALFITAAYLALRPRDPRP